MRIVAIIPARFASTRFPGKPLIDIGGKSMIQRVIEQVQLCPSISEILVATDDERIAKHVNALGVKCVMTRADHPSGTDRCLEALQLCGIAADGIINVQGDEPFVDPAQLEQLTRLISEPEVSIATLAKEITESSTLFDPSKVKVIFDAHGRALYFSRQAIPYQRDRRQEDWLKHHTYFKHIGLYAYKADTLRAICQLRPSELEKAESLEQLRWLENGHSIAVALTDIETPSVDTPADLEAILNNLS